MKKGKKELKKGKSTSIFNSLNKVIGDFIYSFIDQVIVPRKKVVIPIIITIFIFFSILSIGVIGVSTYYIIKYRHVVYSFFTSGYTYKYKRQLEVKLASPIRIKLPIEQEITVPFKKRLSTRVPFKAVLSIPVKHTFDIPFEEPLKIHVNHAFPVKEFVKINSVFPIDTTVTVSVFGIDKDVRINGEFPLNVDVPIDHEFSFNETIEFQSMEPISVPVNYVFDVPVDIEVDVDIPIDMELTVPLKIDIDTDLIIEEKLPLILEFDMIINPFKGIEIIQ